MALLDLEILKLRDSLIQDSQQVSQQMADALRSTPAVLDARLTSLGGPQTPGDQYLWNDQQNFWLKAQAVLFESEVAGIFISTTRWREAIRFLEVSGLPNLQKAAQTLDAADLADFKHVYAGGNGAASLPRTIMAGSERTVIAAIKKADKEVSAAALRDGRRPVRVVDKAQGAVDAGLLTSESVYRLGLEQREVDRFRREQERTGVSFPFINVKEHIPRAGDAWLLGYSGGKPKFSNTAAGAASSTTMFQLNLSDGKLEKQSNEDSTEFDGHLSATAYVACLARLMRAAAVCGAFSRSRAGGLAGEVAASYIEYILVVTNSSSPRVARKLDELIRSRIDSRKIPKAEIAAFLLAEDQQLLHEAERAVSSETGREQQAAEALRRSRQAAQDRAAASSRTGSAATVGPWQPNRTGSTAGGVQALAGGAEVDRPERAVKRPTDTAAVGPMKKRKKRVG